MAEISESMMRLGMNQNEARILETLFSNGPLGATDINRHSGVPRNKIYEILDRLSREGVVEVQPGRPILYRAAEPRSVVESMVEKYRKAGEEVKEALAVLQSAQINETDPAAYAWVVRGREAAKRKLAELVFGAAESIFIVGGFPNQYLNHVTTALKAAAQRGVKTRAIHMVSPMETMRDDMSNRNILEYRSVRISSLGPKTDQYDVKLLEGFRTTAKNGCAAIFDETLAFNVVDEYPEPEMVTGILVKAPGAPRIQKGTIERIMAKYTRKL